jgi:hypothetical protein
MGFGVGLWDWLFSLGGLKLATKDENLDGFGDSV